MILICLVFMNRNVEIKVKITQSLESLLSRVAANAGSCRGVFALAGAQQPGRSQANRIHDFTRPWRVHCREMAIWEHMDAGHLEISNDVPQGMMSYVHAAGSKMRLQSPHRSLETCSQEARG